MQPDYLQSTKNKILELWGREPRSLDELAECVVKVIGHYKYRHFSKHGTTVITPKVVGFKWDLSYGPVSNSHSRPIGGIKNWGGDVPGGPRNYPGWAGRVYIRYADSPPSFGSEPFGSTLTYPGTGGFGAYSGPWQTVTSWYYYTRCAKQQAPISEPQVYSWDYRFFSSDWPDLGFYELFEKVKTGQQQRQHSYCWYDPETQHKDQQFIDWCQGNQAVLEVANTK